MEKVIKNKGKRTPVWLQALIVAITLTAVAVVIFLGSQTYRETRKMATEQFNQQQLILARSTAVGIEAYIKELRATLSSVAKIPSIQQMDPECLQCIQQTHWGLPSRTSIRLLDSNGALNFIYPFDGWRGELVGRDYSEDTYFQEAKEPGRIIVSGLIINEQGETRIRIAVPVYLTYKTKTVRVGDKTGIIITPIDPGKPESGRFQGVLVGSFDPHTIAQEFISPIVSGKTGYAWLLNEDGIFLAHHEEGFTGRNAFEVRKERNPEISYRAIEQIQRQMMAGEEGVGRYISGWHLGERGEIEKLVAYTPVHTDGQIWSVAVCAPISEVEEIIHISKRSELYTVVFVILALIIGGAFLFLTSYRWSHSLEREVAYQTKELRETSDYLNNLIRHANAPIIVWNPDKQVIIFNEAFEKMSGWSEAEMVEQPLNVLFPEESRSDSLQKIENASKGKSWETVEIPILRKDGEIHIGLWNSANIYSEDGKLIATVAQGQDITERKQAEEALQSEKEKFRILVEESPLGVSIIGEDGRYKYINPKFIEIFGYTLEDIPTGQEWFRKAYPDKEYRNQVISTWISDLKGLKSGESRPRTFAMICKDGSEKMIQFRPVAIETGDQFVIYEDITEMKRLEAQLLQAQKMEAIGTLSGGVAHDFNNILTAILGYTDLAMMKVDETDPLYRDLKQIDLSATRAASLTRQLLLFSRRQPIQFTSFNLNTMVDNLLKMLHRLIGEDITINTDLNPELWTVQADAGNIEQVIMNLTVNARDAMPGGGTLTIKTENMHVDEDYCKTYTYAHQGRFVCISVQDTGVGMDKETINSIFEPFFTTKGPGKGTGMGLSVVYGIVKQHEGWVNVYSEPGQGSILKIYLPASSLKPEEETKKTVSLKELQGSGERILLVEDEEEVREFAIMVLGENGYVVYEAASAEEALDIFDKEAGSFDLIFSDVILPDKTGIELVDQLLSRKGELRILLSSGYTDHKSQWPVIRKKGFRFLQKPYGLTDLLRAIREAIEQDK